MLDGTSIFRIGMRSRCFWNKVELNVKAFKLPNLINRYVYVYLRARRLQDRFGMHSDFWIMGQ